MNWIGQIYKEKQQFGNNQDMEKFTQSTPFCDRK